MTVQIEVNAPFLRDTFTVSATCQSCADQAASSIRELNEVAAEAGLTGAMHSLRGIDPQLAVIVNSGGDQMNGVRNYDCV